MAFWHVCQKANCITKSAFSCLFPPFRLFHWIRLLDFPALIAINTHEHIFAIIIDHRCYLNTDWLSSFSAEQISNKRLFLVLANLWGGSFFILCKFQWDPSHFLFPLERVSVEATWALGWVDHWATPAMRWTTFSQMKRKTRYIQTGTLIHFPIQRIREIGMQRDGEIYVWYFHFFLFTSGLDEVHWPQRQNWYCKLLRPIEFFQVAHTWTPHCSAGALDVGG